MKDIKMTGIKIKNGISIDAGMICHTIKMACVFAMVFGAAAIASAQGNKEKATDLPREAPQQSLGKEKPDILFIAIDDGPLNRCSPTVFRK